MVRPTDPAASVNRSRSWSIIGGRPSAPASAWPPSVRRLTLSDLPPAREGASPTPEPSPSAGGSDGGRSPSTPSPPGVREQFGRVRAAAGRLLAAHLTLARAEFAQIMGEVKAVAVRGGLAVGLVLFVAVLLPVGSILFLGEWLFGSIAWGVVDGAALLLAVAAVLLLDALRPPRSWHVRGFVLALLIGVAIGLVLGLDLLNQAWTRLGESVQPSLGWQMSPADRPLVVAVATVSLVLAVLGLLLGAWRGGLGGAFGGLIGGALLGIPLGAFSAIAFGPRAGAAFGVLFALIAWPLLVGWPILRGRYDWEALKARFIPSESMEAAQETMAELRGRMPRRGG